MPSHEGDVAVIDGQDVLLGDTVDLVAPERHDHGGCLVSDNRLHEVPRAAKLRVDGLPFPQAEDLH